MAAKSCANSDQKMVDDAASLISTEVDWMLDDVTVECIAQNSVEVGHDIYQPAVDDVLELNGKDHIGSCYEEVQQLRVDDSHGAHTSKHCDAFANDLEDHCCTLQVNWMIAFWMTTVGFLSNYLFCSFFGLLYSYLLLVSFCTSYSFPIWSACFSNYFASPYYYWSPANSTTVDLCWADPASEFSLAGLRNDPH